MNLFQSSFLEHFLKSKKFWSVLLSLAFVSFGFWDINGSGQTWDERSRYYAGVKYVSNWKNLKFGERDWEWFYEHPPVSKYIYGVAAVATERWFPDNPSYVDYNYTLTRVASALMTAVTLVFVLLLGWEFFSPTVGVLAAVLFSLNPQVLAYAKNTSLESPTLLFFTVSVYFFLKALKEGGNSKAYLTAGLMTGLAFSTRFSNFLLLPLFGVIFVLSQWGSVKKKKEIRLPLNLVLGLLISCVVFYAVWPWLWSAPFDRLMKSLNFWQEQGAGNPPPLYYYFQYFLITTPALLFVFLGSFLLRLYRTKNFWLLVLVLWFLTPFLFTFAKYRQGGIRLMIPIFVPLSLMTAIGLSEFGRQLGRFKYLFFSLVPIYLFFLALSVHPYYLDFFNEVVGGPKGAVERGISLMWWGEGVKEAVDFVNQTAPQGSTFQSAVVPLHAMPRLRGDLVRLKPIIAAHMVNEIPWRDEPGTYLLGIDRTKMADYLVVYNVGVAIPEEYEEVYASKVSGAELATVYRLK